jgi:hypothetical protein
MIEIVSQLNSLNGHLSHASRESIKIPQRNWAPRAEMVLKTDIRRQDRPSKILLSGVITFCMANEEEVLVHRDFEALARTIHNLHLSRDNITTNSAFYPVIIQGEITDKGLFLHCYGFSSDKCSVAR